MKDVEIHTRAATSSSMLDQKFVNRKAKCECELVGFEGGWAELYRGRLCAARTRQAASNVQRHSYMSHGNAVSRYKLLSALRYGNDAAVETANSPVSTTMTERTTQLASRNEGRGQFVVNYYLILFRAGCTYKEVVLHVMRRVISTHDVRFRSCTSCGCVPVARSYPFYDFIANRFSRKLIASSFLIPSTRPSVCV